MIEFDTFDIGLTYLAFPDDASLPSTHDQNNKTDIEFEPNTSLPSKESNLSSGGETEKQNNKENCLLTEIKIKGRENFRLEAPRES